MVYVVWYGGYGMMGYDMVWYDWYGMVYGNMLHG